jgi:hypothetical protein
MGIRETLLVSAAIGDIEFTEQIKTYRVTTLGDFNLLGYTVM